MPETKNWDSGDCVLCSAASSFLSQSFWPVFYFLVFLLNSQENHYSLSLSRSLVLLNLHVCPRKPRLIMIMSFFFCVSDLLEASEQTGASSSHGSGEDQESIQQGNTLGLHGYIYKWSCVLFCIKLYWAGNSLMNAAVNPKILGARQREKTPTCFESLLPM